MKLPLLLSVILTLVSPVIFADSSKSACMLEGSFTMMGQKIEIKDCLQNNGIPHEHFVESCNSISNSTAAFGAKPAKITYMAACPASAQARCEKLFGGQLSGYYYLRDPQALADSETSCKAGGGTWAKGG